MVAFLFVCIWLPGSACAQLYVAQDGSVSVGEYNATSGAVLSANYITISMGISYPTALALSGNKLFVANAGGNTVSEYDVSNEKMVVSNPNFIAKGLSWPIGLAISGTNLYVANGNGNASIGEYNTTTAAVINSNFIPAPLDLGGPSALAVSSDGNTLFVAHYQQFNNSKNPGRGSVSTYDAKSGALINGNLIIGLQGPAALAVSGDTLYVVNSGYTGAGTGSVGKYSASSGAAINASFITGLNQPFGIATFGNTVFVAIRGSGLGTVEFYDANSGALDKAHSITGILSPYGLAVGAASTPLSPTRILFLDASTGKTVDATQTMQSVVVGQQIQLRADPAGSGPWEVNDSEGKPARLVKEYTTPPIPIAYQSSDAKSEALVTPVNLSGPARTSFYFVTPGAIDPSIYSVIYHYTQSNGKPASAVAKFEVDGPGATVTPSPTPGIFKPLQPEANANPTYSFPIKFQLTPIAAKSHKGNFFWTQLVDNMTETQVDARGITVAHKPVGLDNTFPYAGGDPSNHSFLNCYNSDTGDAPGEHLTPGYFSFNEQASFRMYLMWEWQSSAPNTIPVSLGFLPWSFEISLLMNGETPSIDPKGLNQFKVGAFIPILKNTEPEKDFPQWTSVAVNEGNAQTIKPCGPPP
jgi:hypothetical protein